MYLSSPLSTLTRLKGMVTGKTEIDVSSDLQSPSTILPAKAFRCTPIGNTTRQTSHWRASPITYTSNMSSALCLDKVAFNGANNRPIPGAEHKRLQYLCCLLCNLKFRHPHKRCCDEIPLDWSPTLLGVGPKLLQLPISSKETTHALCYLPQSSMTCYFANLAGVVERMYQPRLSPFFRFALSG